MDISPALNSEGENIMINLIPIPYEYKMLDGYFFFSDDPQMQSDFELPLIKFKRCDNADIIVKKNSSLPEEAYTLEVKKNGIIITSCSEIGTYYAFQSLRQISKYELGVRRVPCCVINDRPKYK